MLIVFSRSKDDTGNMKIQEVLLALLTLLANKFFFPTWSLCRCQVPVDCAIMPLSPNQRHHEDIKYYDMKCFLCRKPQVESATSRRKQQKGPSDFGKLLCEENCPLTPSDSVKTTGKHQILTQSGGKVGATGSWGKYKATHLSRSTQKHNDRKSQVWTPSGRATSRTGNTHTRKKTTTGV